MKPIILLTTIALTLGGLYLSTRQEELDSMSMFNNWKINFGRKYAEIEEEFRYRVYVENLDKINKHNSDWTQTYKMGENNLMDLTHEEFVQIYLNSIDVPQTLVEEQIEEQESLTEEQLSSIPNGIDWRGYTTMKDQGYCASGWAFSVTSSTEAGIFIWLQEKIDLSEQHLVDCVIQAQGCQGGNNTAAFNYAKSNGIKISEDYPYIAEKSSCKYPQGDYQITGYKQILGETKIRAALQSLPISVGVEASNWQFYSSGVFGNCGTTINHYVLNVGYEVNTNNWFIKNSWGSTWGEAGHIRLFTGTTCGVTLKAYQIQ